MAKIYDVSMPVHPGMPVYKNKAEKQPVIEVVRDFDNGGGGDRGAPGAQGTLSTRDVRGIRETHIHLDAHTGTHVDAPLHIMPGGPTLEEAYDPEMFFGTCRVLDLIGVEERITRRDLEDQGIQAGEFILCQTRNSWREGFDFNFVDLAPDAAQYLAEKGIRGVGLDALGIERDQPDHASHRALLEKRIMVVEGLRLKEVPPGAYLLLVAPLKLIGTEAAPARVLLLG